MGDPEPDGGPVLLAVPALHQHPARPNLPLSLGLPRARSAAAHRRRLRRLFKMASRPTDSVASRKAKATRGEGGLVARGFCGGWDASLAGAFPPGDARGDGGLGEGRDELRSEMKKGRWPIC
jgi:hypothetical protein